MISHKRTNKDKYSSCVRRLTFNAAPSPTFERCTTDALGLPSLFPEIHKLYTHCIPLCVVNSVKENFHWNILLPGQLPTAATSRILMGHFSKRFLYLQASTRSSRVRIRDLIILQLYVGLNVEPGGGSENYYATTFKLTWNLRGAELPSPPMRASRFVPTPDVERNACCG